MQAEQAVKYMAMHDALTRLPNRGMFNERLASAIAVAQRHERTLAVLFVDLDRFKVINDTLGHEAGDEVLREVDPVSCAICGAATRWPGSAATNSSSCWRTFRTRSTWAPSATS